MKVLTITLSVWVLIIGLFIYGYLATDKPVPNTFEIIERVNK